MEFWRTYPLQVGIAIAETCITIAMADDINHYDRCDLFPVTLHVQATDTHMLRIEITAVWVRILIIQRVEFAGVGVGKTHQVC